MAEINTASYAFAGSGDVDEGNAAALLDDYLPQALGAVYRPERVPRSNKALSAVINWLESDDVLGPKGTIGSPDLIGDLVNRRKEGDAVVELVVLWPAEPSEDDLSLAKAAFDAGIPVKNLSAALDDLLEDDVFPPDVEPEPEAPAAEAVAEVVESVATAVASTLGADLERAIRAIVQDEIERKLAAVPAKVADKASVEKVAAKLSAKPKEIKDDTDKPPFDPPYKSAPAGEDDGQERIAYYMNEDGQYRKAKARPRRGEQRVLLTLEEIDSLVHEGRITDN